MRIICPSAKLGKSQRISELFKNIEHWISSKPIEELVALFGGFYPGTCSLEEKIVWMEEFAKNWDYRRKQSADSCLNERWNIQDDSFIRQHTDTILKCARQLGLIDGTLPVSSPDYILPLGGARMSNLERTRYTKLIMEKTEGLNVSSVALSGMRPIAQEEKSSVSSYAPYAETEFDAINAGLETALSLSPLYTETIESNPNINLCSRIRRYKETYKGCPVFSLAAPSSSPQRRANSRDTFEFFLDSFQINPQDSLLLVTSQIYVPYQLLKFVDLAIDKGFDVDCVGYSNQEQTGFQKSSNYLQEIKATVNSIYYLYNKYKKELSSVSG